MEDMKIYSNEELEELIAWFDGKDLPQSLWLDKATFIPDVEGTLEKLISQARVCYANPKMQGAIFLLERLKTKLKETQN